MSLNDAGILVDDDRISFSYVANAVVTCEIKLFQNDFTLRRRPSEIKLLDTCLKLLQNYFRGLLQLMNIFQRVQCRRNIILK